MSDSKKTLEEALSGVDPVDWSQFPELDGQTDEQTSGTQDSSQKTPQDDNTRNKRGVKVTKPHRKKHSFEFEVTEEDKEILDSIGKPLHNAALPELRIQQEKTDHRFLVYLFARGKGLIEVFQALGGKIDPVTRQPLPTKVYGGKYSYAHLTQIRRQPWFQKEVLDLMKQQGEDIVAATFQSEFESSVETIIKIRDDKESKDSTRLAAANTLLDRFLGKPTQHVKSEITKKTLGEIAKDKVKLDKELEVIEAEIVAMNPKPVRKL